MSDFTNKVVLITGGCSGIGLATVKILLSQGAKVFCLDLRQPLDEALAKGDNPNFYYQKTDVSSAEQRKAGVEGCKAKFGGRIDSLLNVAGAMDNFAGVGDITDEGWDRMIAINLTAPTMMMKEVVKTMVAQGGGSIVNVCSMAAISGTGAGLAYTAAKTGLVGVTKASAWRYRGNGIRVNATCPGGVATNIFETLRGDIDEAGLATLKPLSALVMGDRRGTPEDQANVIVFLASDLSREMTGTIIPVDDGWSCK